MRIVYFLILAFSLSFCSQPTKETINKNHRVIVLSDIEADPDDTQSLVRLLLYSNEIDIKGLVATTSCWLKTEVNPASIEKVLKAYGEVHSNLLMHDENYPDADRLMRLVKQGLPVYGMLGVGEGKDSEGSELIIRELEKKDDRPLWISTWGGVNTLAQALYKIEKTKSKEEANSLIAKLRVYTISDQDDAGIWIRNNFPSLFYIVSPGDYYGGGGDATWAGVNTVVNNYNNEVISNSWFATNIQQNHGTLGASYPDVSWGVEGDTPAFLSLISNGLNEPERPDFGGWGGRYELYKPDFIEGKSGSAGSGVPLEPETRPIWTNAIDAYTPYITGEYGRAVKLDTITFNDNRLTIWRWRDDFQNDFAARMDWCIMPYEEANHPPVPVLSHPEQITVKSGEGFMLDAFNSYDPDGDNLSFLWFQYPEAGSYKETIKLGPPENSHRIFGTAPVVEKEQTVHIVLKVTDKGSPKLTRYKRVIVNIQPE